MGSAAVAEAEAREPKAARGEALPVVRAVLLMAVVQAVAETLRSQAADAFVEATAVAWAMTEVASWEWQTPDRIAAARS